MCADFNQDTFSDRLVNLAKAIIFPLNYLQQKKDCLRLGITNSEHKLLSVLTAHSGSRTKSISELARIVGWSRQWTSEVVSSLRAKGLISIHECYDYKTPMIVGFRCNSNVKFTHTSIYRMSPDEMKSELNDLFPGDVRHYVDPQVNLHQGYLHSSSNICIIPVEPEIKQKRGFTAPKGTPTPKRPEKPKRIQRPKVTLLRNAFAKAFPARVHKDVANGYAIAKLVNDLYDKLGFDPVFEWINWFLRKGKVFYDVKNMNDLKNDLMECIPDWVNIQYEKMINFGELL